MDTRTNPTSDTPKKRKSRKPTKLTEIKIFLGDKTLLKEKFDTTYYTVRKALDGETNTALGYEIRESAIKDFGGKEIPLEESEKTVTKSLI